MRLEFKNNLTGKVVVIPQEWTEVIEYNYNYKVKIRMIPICTEDLTDCRMLVDGEYTMTLYDDDNNVLSEELCQYGDYTKQRQVEYKEDKNKKFVQYNG